MSQSRAPRVHAGGRPGESLTAAVAVTRKLDFKQRLPEKDDKIARREQGVLLQEKRKWRKPDLP